MFNNSGRVRKQFGQTLRHCSGQSTVEYIILVTAVMGVIILFMTGNNNLFQGKLTNVLSETTNQIKDKSETLSDSHNTPSGQVQAPQITVNPLPQQQ